jgi:hypothetical protein
MHGHMNVKYAKGPLLCFGRTFVFEVNFCTEVLGIYGNNGEHVLYTIQFYSQFR